MYPLKFHPVFQQRLWGGRRLATLLAKPLPGGAHHASIGESWELADLPAGTVKADSTGAAPDGSFASSVANGPFAGKNLQQLLRSDRAAIMGHAPLIDGHFPLLIKFLDARLDLSVQVHPDKAYCAAHPDSHLKCEAWYIVHAEPGAVIYHGLKPGTTREVLAAALKNGEIAPLLNTVKVRPGECYYLPSGIVHALGAGILVAEVQTPSDTTFRAFDWNRRGPDGRPRALHVEEALACIDFAAQRAPALQSARPGSSAVAQPGQRLLGCDYFTIDRMELPASTEHHIPSGEPLIWIILRGQGVIQCQGAAPTAFTRGEMLLLPAQMQSARMKTVADSAWLEVRLPTDAAPIG